MYGWGMGQTVPATTTTAIATSPATLNGGELSIFAAGGGVLIGVFGLASKDSAIAMIGFGIAAVAGFMFLQGVSTVH